ncbi:MAG: hypothetical protein JXA22_04060 [Candidatus Thermoplasmatota archaeon]|nr:hypothetical protein [Candidatus Thermoplasmatota archaeon]
MKGNVLVSLTDKNYIDPVKQLFSSVYYNSGWQGDYLLLCHDIDDKDIQWFKDKGIITKNVEPLYDKDFEHFPPTILSKLYLFGIDFKRWKRVLFLDGDITVRACLDGMLVGPGLRAVEDVHSIPLKKQFYDDRHLPDNGSRIKMDRLRSMYDMKRTAFNVGVLSFDTEMIEVDTFKKICDLFHEYGLLSPYNEQAILNLHFIDRWNPMPLIYNNYYLYVRPYWTLEPKRFEGICDHFIFQKPWKVRQGPYFADWLHYLDLAKDMDLDDRPPSARKWTESEIMEWTSYMKDMMVHRSRPLILNNKIMETLESGLGISGKMLRTVSPSMYNRIRRERYHGSLKDQ